MPLSCSGGCGRRPMLKRPKTGDTLCKECFFHVFEEEVHHTIITAKLFTKGEYVAIGASGGKDSTVLAHLMTLLNARYSYGLKLALLSIDEGIAGYRDDSLETVKRNEKQYGIPLTILSYQELYGWTMDTIVQQVGRKNNCTFCGVFRRQALDRGAQLLGVDKLVTGHNADDIAETIVMNILRGDVARLQRCCAVETGSEGSLPRSKPFKYTYEKEIVMYAYFKKLDYFTTECIYSPNAYRGHARAYIKDLEKIRPSSIIDIIHSGECLSIKEGVKLPTQSLCTRCGHVSSQAVCKACVLLEGLNKGRPRLGVGKSSKVTARMKINPTDLVGTSSSAAGEGNMPVLNSLQDTKGGTKATTDHPGQDSDASDLGETSSAVRKGNNSLVLEPKQNSEEETKATTDRPVTDRSNINGLSVDLSGVSVQDSVDSSDKLLLKQYSSEVYNGTLEESSKAAADVVVKEMDVRNGLDLDMTSGQQVEATATGSDTLTKTTGKSLPTKKVFSLRKKENTTTLLTDDHNDSTANDKPTEEELPEPPQASKKCSSLPTSIEDIGNNPVGGVCASGGKCSSNCQNKGRKARKVVSLKKDPELAFKNAGISKKDLDF